MGYYTDYTLSVYSAVKKPSGSIEMSSDIPSALEKEIDKEIEKMNVFADGDIRDSYYVNTTWYDHELDMRLLSARFPDIVFWLSGHGEGYEDHWQKFFVGGKMQECYAQVIYDDFDSSKLDGETVSVDNILRQRYTYQMR